MRRPSLEMRQIEVQNATWKFRMGCAGLCNQVPHLAAQQRPQHAEELPQVEEVGLLQSGLFGGELQGALGHAVGRLQKSRPRRS